jgi:YebC/PmpR family DNA-binding regulatory protein
MGRIFEKRKERMFARWAKMAKAFTKMGKEIAIAVKLGGGDPASNPRLRLAIQTARSLNMPKDRIEAAIDRASGKGAEELFEITYEGFGPHKVAVIVETATDNNTRTVANVRSIFNRWGGTLASSGALKFVFERKGVFRVSRSATLELSNFELTLIDYGLEELVEIDDDSLLLYCTFEGYVGLQRCLEEMKIDIQSAGIEQLPLNFIDVSSQEEADVEKLVSALEEDDDVQSVYTNLRVKD